ncbi:MAG: hypothetical protein ABH846_01210 [Patescibacteria group bacterium]
MSKKSKEDSSDKAVFVAQVVNVLSWWVMYKFVFENVLSDTWFEETVHIPGGGTRRLRQPVSVVAFTFVAPIVVYLFAIAFKRQKVYEIDKKLLTTALYSTASIYLCIIMLYLFSVIL